MGRKNLFWTRPLDASSVDIKTYSLYTQTLKMRNFVNLTDEYDDFKT